MSMTVDEICELAKRSSPMPADMLLSEQGLYLALRNIYDSYRRGIIDDKQGKREKLNAILHPMVYGRMEQEIRSCKEKGLAVVVLDVPLLFEVGAEALADITVCATSPEEVQIERMRTRSGLNREQALSRIRSQMPVSEKEARSDVVLDTNKPLSQLQQDVQKLYHSWADAAL